ncbi:MAG: hypothetical protein ABJA10_07550 [Aestuariivirga sp.]
MSLLFDWPRSSNWKPLSGKFTLAPIGHISQSPYTGSLKAISLTQIWKADFAFNNHSLADGIDIQGFLEGLEGSANTVRLYDPWRVNPLLLSTAISGFDDGTLFDDGTGFTAGWTLAVLNAAAKGSAYVSISGLPVSQACFKRGDLIGINECLYQIRSGVTSNAAGQAMLWIQPGLRAGVAAGDVVNSYYPTVVMRLASPLDATINRDPVSTSAFSVSFIEDIQT